MSELLYFLHLILVVRLSHIPILLSSIRQKHLLINRLLKLLEPHHILPLLRKSLLLSKLIKLRRPLLLLKILSVIFTSLLLKLLLVPSLKILLEEFLLLLILELRLLLIVEILIIRDLWLFKLLRDLSRYLMNILI